MFVSARKLITASSASRKGFTLIELMVAISIVAILATIGIIMFSGAQGSARDAKRKGDLDDLKKAMYLYQTGAQTFCFKKVASECTATDPWGAMLDSTSYGFGVSSTITPGSSLFGSSTTVTKYDISLEKNLKPYLKANTLPHDLLKSSNWPDFYIKVTSDTTFELYAKLEGATKGTECTSYTPNLSTSGTTMLPLSSEDAKLGLYNYCITQ